MFFGIKKSILELDGTILNASITKDEILDIKKAKNIREIDSVLGGIIDFFYGTHKEEAKKDFFYLTHNETKTIDKINAFSNLKQLSSEQYKKNFSYVHTNGNEVFKINDEKEDYFKLYFSTLTLRSCECNSLNEQLNAVQEYNVVTQFSLDSGRSDYFYNDEEKTKEEIESILSDNIVVKRGLSQTMFAIVSELFMKKRGRYYDVPGGSKYAVIQYKVTSIQDGLFDITATIFKDVSLASDDIDFKGFLNEIGNTPWVKSLKIEVELTADNEKIEVTSARQSVELTEKFYNEWIKFETDSKQNHISGRDSS